MQRSLLLGIPVGVIGMSFGALAVAAGMAPAMVCGMSVLVFAGGSQFVALAVVTGGGSAVAAVVSGLLLNARFLAFGMTLAPRLHGRWHRRAAAAHLLVDESFALALAEPDPRRARAAFVCSGAVLFALWNLGTVAGVAAGSTLGSPQALGLDVALPAAMLYLVAPLVGSRRTWAAAVLGGALAVAAVPVTPSGAPVMVAAVGAVIALAVPEANVAEVET